MRFAFLVLLALTPQILSAAPNSTQNMSTYDPATELRRTPAASSRSPSIRACSYYSEGARITDIARLEMHSKTCESDQSIDKKLPDRPETDIYRVGEPFDVPKRN